MRKFYLVTMILFSSFIWLKAQNWSLEATVSLRVLVKENPASITLRWDYYPNATRYFVYRKTKEAKSWGSFIANYPSDSLSFTDRNVEVGKTYEYRVSRTSSSITANGYVLAGIKYVPPIYKPKIAVFVESKFSTVLKNEINQLVDDLENENWTVLVRDIPNAIDVKGTKALITGLVKLHPSLKTILLLGHIDVPYSGNSAYDGHPDHQGAWPADSYYADIDGIWTDTAVNNTVASRAENKNIPNDGKFDNSSIPSDLELEIGRVDFSNLPVFGVSDTVMMKRYLNKNHLYRTGQIRSMRRAMVQDNFNFQNEGFGQSGYQSFIPLFNSDNVFSGAFRDSLLTGSYLCSFGAGGGNYEGAAGISSSGLMATDSLQTVFTFLFGSYFGDWDIQNAFMRSALGSGTVLTTAWAGRPAMHLHQMSMGDHIGSSMLITSNNVGIYTAGLVGARGTHIALMGDPTLVLFPIKPPSSLSINKFGHLVNLDWSTSSDATEGYVVYRKKATDTIYSQIAIVDTNYFQDKCLTKDILYEYMVKARKLEKNASGSFYNVSPGVKDDVLSTIDYFVQSDFELTNDHEFAIVRNNVTKESSLEWVLNQRVVGSDTLQQIAMPCRDGKATICQVTTGYCNVDTLCKTLNYACSIPTLVSHRITNVKCAGDPPASIFLDSIAGAATFKFLWNTGATTRDLINVPDGSYDVTVRSRLNTSDKFTFQVKHPTEVQFSVSVTDAKPGQNGSVNIQASGGTPPYKITLDPQRPLNDLPVGNYVAIVIDANGCIKMQSFEVKLNTATFDLSKNEVNIYPQPTADFLIVKSNHPIQQVRIVNLEGKELRKSNYHQNELKMEVKDLTSGWYVVHILSGQKWTQRKFEKI